MPLSAVADVDLDGRPEIVAGNAVYEAEDCALKWANGRTDGYPAVANFDADPAPEIVVVSQGTVRLQEAADGFVVWSAAVPGGGGVGAPTVADFDGDGAPEVGAAGAAAYAVFETDGSLKWSRPTIDQSSNVTGSSVFDFEGDGRAEAVYGDECFLYVYDGATGEVLFKRTKSSGTTLENPVIVDVNNDGNAEIVVAANSYASGIGVRCAAADAAFAGMNNGIIVFADALDNWVPTRRVWNQHTYHVTNIGEDGRVPAREARHFETFNSFRQNVQGEGVFDAPDLVVTDLSVDLSECFDFLRLRARVVNRGSRGVRAGVPVAFYRRDAAGEVLLGVVATPRDLLPGGEVMITLRVAVPVELRAVLSDFVARADDDGSGAGLHNECNEGNNAAVLERSGCALECPPEVVEPGPERCNGLDDDCDGEVDEGLWAVCHTPCGAGVAQCNGARGELGACSAPAPEDEVCDGVDNDCDGTVDEAADGATLRNACGGCGPGPGETCNGVDDDCDTVVDEAGEGLCPRSDQPCTCGECAEPCIRGECGAGRICAAGYCVRSECGP
jgi:hypothetical protein